MQIINLVALASIATAVAVPKPQPAKLSEGFFFNPIAGTRKLMGEQVKKAAINVAGFFKIRHKIRGAAKFVGKSID